jgi:hypothetical protein
MQGDNNSPVRLWMKVDVVATPHSIQNKPFSLQNTDDLSWRKNWQLSH